MPAMSRWAVACCLSLVAVLALGLLLTSAPPAEPLSRKPIDPGQLTRVTFGSLADCVRSAIEGRVVRDESLWESA